MGDHAHGKGYSGISITSYRTTSIVRPYRVDSPRSSRIEAVGYMKLRSTAAAHRGLRLQSAACNLIASAFGSLPVAQYD